MNKILITGASGFIGSYLVRFLIDRGYEVAVLVRNVPDYLLELFQKVEIYHADITEPISLDLTKRYDVIIHLAAANDIDSKDPKKAVNITVLGTRNVLDFCVKNQISKFIYFSTYQVYGIATEIIKEDSPINCVNDYAITHYFAEEYVKMYQKQHNIDYVITRVANIYGGFLHKKIDRWSLVPNCFVKDAFENQTITLSSSGKQKRDFISLEDVSGATELLIAKFESIKNSVVNIASGRSISIIEIAEITKNVYESHFNKRCKINTGSDSCEEIKSFGFDTRKLQNLGFSLSEEFSLENEIGKIFNLLAKDTKNGSHQRI